MADLKNVYDIWQSSKTGSTNLHDVLIYVLFEELESGYPGLKFIMNLVRQVNIPTQRHIVAANLVREDSLP